MNLLKNIFFSQNTFMVFVILIISSLINIQHSYSQIMLDEYSFKDLKNNISSMFFISFILVNIYSVLFYLKTKEYINKLKSYTKPFEFISLITTLLATLGTILWDYRFIKFDSTFKPISFKGNSIDIDINVLNSLNIYLNLFIFLSAFLLLLIIFLLLLNFNIEDYKNKNRLYKEYILTKNGWIEGSYKLSNNTNETKVIEPDKVLLVVRAFINFSMFELYKTRYFLEPNLLKKNDYFIEEIELIKKHFDDKKISKYFEKYDSYFLEQYNIKNIEILKKFK
ncbi:hypothetical protein AF78_03090 [Aliarcobacter butzleri L353]|uniref:hypothetical protein n=1 Tax=Aliarcobacter butzleri TaxID=28197 RepID=UPI0006585F01|nr:hypothetical protein [Aliarcobacter butzleri]KLE06523.1 hypothetical protein AF78_03090 [Aliarcobacter butzleri L353]